MTMIGTKSMVAVSAEPIGPDHWSWEQVCWINDAWMVPLSDLFVGFDPTEISGVLLIQTAISATLREALEHTAFSHAETCSLYEVWVRAL